MSSAQRLGGVANYVVVTYSFCARGFMSVSVYRGLEIRCGKIISASAGCAGEPTGVGNLAAVTGLGGGAIYRQLLSIMPIGRLSADGGAASKWRRPGDGVPVPRTRAATACCCAGVSPKYQRKAVHILCRRPAGIAWREMRAEIIDKPSTLRYV